MEQEITLFALATNIVSDSDTKRTKGECRMDEDNKSSGYQDKPFSPEWQNTDPSLGQISKPTVSNNGENTSDMSAYMAALPAMLAEARREKASIMSPSDYLMPLVTAYIPVVGMIVAAVGRKKENPNRRNFFKVSFWTNLVVTVLFIIIAGFGVHYLYLKNVEPDLVIVSESDTSEITQIAEAEIVSESDTIEEKTSESETESDDAAEDTANTSEEEAVEPSESDSASEATKSESGVEQSTEAKLTDTTTTAKDETVKSDVPEKTEKESEPAETPAPPVEKYTFNSENNALAVRINGTLVAVPVTGDALSAWDHVDTSADESDATQEIAFYYDKDRSSISLVMDIETKAVKMAQLFFAGAGTEIAGLTKASTPQNALDTFTTATTVDTSDLDEGQQNGSIAFHFGDSHAITILFSEGVAMMVTVQ